MLTKEQIAKKLNMTVRGLEKRIARGEFPKPDGKIKRVGKAGLPRVAWCEEAIIGCFTPKKTHKGKSSTYDFAFNNM